MNEGAAPEPVRARLFVGLLPPPRQQRALAEAAADLRHGGKAVPTGNLHMTLAFLGAVRREHVDTLCDGLAGVEAEAFELRLERIGLFPRARVLWCAATSAPAALYALQGGVARAVTAAGIALEARPFTPHVTVARKVSRYRGPASLRRAVTWQLREFQLVESRTLPAGARFRALRAFRLQP